MTKRAEQTHKITITFNNGARDRIQTASSEENAHKAGRAAVAKSKRYDVISTYTVEAI